MGEEADNGNRLGAGDWRSAYNHWMWGLALHTTCFEHDLIFMPSKSVAVNGPLSVSERH